MPDPAPRSAPRLVGVGAGAGGAGAAPVGAVVLVLPGGRAHSTARFRPWQAANLRMVPFRSALRRALSGRAVVGSLHYRVRGWNGAAQDPVRDVDWALGEVGRRHPGARVVLVGHSMGGRAAMYAAGDPRVVAVCALAPWIEPGEPVEQLRDRTVLIAHGDRDTITDPRESLRYATRAQRLGVAASWVPVVGDGHAMLRRAGEWTALTTAFVRSIVDATGPGVPPAR